MIIDTHCHLFTEDFDNDRDICIQRAQSIGVQKILLPNIDCSSISQLYSTESKYPDVCYAMMGLHPSSVKENFEEDLKVIESELKSRKFIGIGEIGMDLYWDKTFAEQQKKAFAIQLEWAVHLNYPVSIHCREAFDPIFDILDRMPKVPKGVFHCFTGTIEQAEKIIRYGTFKLGIGGVITFKKSQLPEVLSCIHESHFVLETDAPYLSPHPFRGKRNEPFYIQVIAEKLADIKNTSVESIYEVCYHNTLDIFHLLK